MKYSILILVLIIATGCSGSDVDSESMIFIGTEILGRPTDSSITVQLSANKEISGYVEYGTTPGVYSGITESHIYDANSPVEIEVTGLDKNTKYYYRFCYKETDSKEYTCREEYSFRTMASKKNTFVFAVQADPHVDDFTSTAGYLNSLYNLAQDNPDFLIDLGDNFMSEKLASTEEEVKERHLLLRSFYEEVCHSIPLFLTLGNHEGETERLLTSENSLPIWATVMRKKYFLNPFPNDFYTGNETDYEFIGKRENYYSWQWGNSLFVVLDPYAYSGESCHLFRFKPATLTIFSKS